MKRIRKGLLPMLAVLMLTAALTVPAAAASRTITINPGINIYLDSQKLEPKDAKGNAVEVFSYNGTTYLPVRAISEALGLQVRWDGSSNSVHITQGSGGGSSASGGSAGKQSTAPKSITINPGITIYLDGKKLNPKDANGKAVEVFSYNGTTYLPVRAISEALGLQVDWDGATNSVYVGQGGSSAKPGQSSGIPAGYVHPSTVNNDAIFGVWELNCEIWTQASQDAQGTWAWFTFRPDGSVDFLNQNLSLTGTYVIKPNANAEEGEPCAMITFPDRTCQVVIYQMYMEVYNMPEITYAVQVGSQTNTGTLTSWSFTQYSTEELFGSPDWN